MAAIVQVNQTSKSCLPDSDLHSIPCKINHDGAANVSGFFVPYLEKSDVDSKVGQQENESTRSNTIFYLNFLFYHLVTYIATMNFYRHGGFIPRTSIAWSRGLHS